MVNKMVQIVITVRARNKMGNEAEYKRCKAKLETLADYLEAEERTKETSRKGGLNLEPLKGALEKQKVRSIRFNDGMRFVLYQDGKTWVVVDFLRNHKHKKIKFKGLSAADDEALEKFIEESSGKKEDPDKKPKPNRIKVSKKVEFFNNKIIYLDAKQVSALDIILDKRSSPHIFLHGAPGCGKTSTMILAVKTILSMDKQSTILILVNSNPLRDFIIEQLDSELDGVNLNRVAVKTPKDIYIQTHGLTPYKDKDKETPYYIDPQGLLWEFNGKSDFLTWYNTYHPQQNKTNQVVNGQKVALLPSSQLEAESIYYEFYTMSGYEKFEDYDAAVKDKCSLFPDVTMRNQLWDVYRHYKDSHLKVECEKDHLKVRPIDLIFEPIVPNKNRTRDTIMMDEAPDLSREQIKSAFKLGRQIIVSVCDHQYLGNLAPLTQYLHTLAWENEITPCDVVLQGSYRCPKKSTELANDTITIKSKIGKVDKHELVSMPINPNHRTGYARWLRDEEELNKLIEKHKKNVHFVVITPDKFVNRAVELFSQKEELTDLEQVSRVGKKFVFTIEQFKGLEATDVLLYFPLEQDDFFAINRVLSHENPLDIGIIHNRALNGLLVALTRNTEKLHIYQPNNHNLRHIITPFKDHAGQL